MNALDERHNLTNAKPNTTYQVGAHGARQGARPILPQITYVACEYTHTVNGTNPDTGMPYTEVTRCQTPAQLTPGYQRACTEHTFHMLLATLNQYLASRNAIPTHQRSPRWQQDVDNATAQRDTLQLIIAGATVTLPKQSTKRANKAK